MKITEMYQSRFFHLTEKNDHQGTNTDFHCRSLKTHFWTGMTRNVSKILGGSLVLYDQSIPVYPSTGLTNSRFQSIPGSPQQWNSIFFHQSSQHI